MRSTTRVMVAAAAVLTCLGSLAASTGAVLAQGAPAGDVDRGKRVFAQCQVCHIADQSGKNRVGPNLWGVVGRPAASIQGFNYSANMRQLGASGHVWTEENLRPYLVNPKAVVPQGIMSFPGFKDNQQAISDVIAYLKSLPAQSH